MATRDSIDHEAGLGQGAYDLSAVDERQSPAVHDYAATVTRRISGRASDGMGMP